MNNVERTIWFVCVIFMIATLVITNLQTQVERQNKQAPKIVGIPKEIAEEIAPEEITPEEITPEEIVHHPFIRISVDGLKGYSSATDFSFKNGLSGDRLVFSKNNANLSLEIRLGEQGETAEEFEAKAARAGREIFQGPVQVPFQDPGQGSFQSSVGWKYYFDESWDSNPNTKAYENIRKVFFIEQEGVLIKAYQYDYTGGKYDKEIEQLLAGVTFY